MSKSILVLDTPKNCGECPISYAYGDSAFIPGGYLCPINDREVLSEAKPNWCPLKSMPKKLKIYYGTDEQDWQKGYNSCLEEIMD